MAEITRSIIIARALDIYPKCGYIWGGWPGAPVPCHFDEVTKRGVSGSGPYIGTDCSGFTAWCWALGYKRHSSAWSKNGEFGSNWHPRSDSSNLSYETLFPGIQAGDVLHRGDASSGHVALYIGNNEIMEASTQSWLATSSGRGMNRTNANFNFSGYVSFDGSMAPSYDPDDTDIDTDNVSDGEVGPTPGDVDLSPEINYYNFYDNQYTRRYAKMKRWRRI